MVIDQMGDKPTPEKSSQVLSKHLRDMLDRFKAKGVKVWLLKQVPEANQPNIAKDVYMLKRFPALNRMSDSAITLRQHQQRQANANKVIDSLPPGLCEVVDPTPLFFKEGENLKIYGERAFYRDSHHLTRYGADYYLSNVFDGILSEIKADGFDSDEN
jgi:hypothetical protein